MYADFEDSIFAGLPSPELDRSWHTLLEKITLRVSAEELRASDQSSVALPRGGYMAWLGVSHELHCIVSGLSTTRSQSNAQKDARTYTENAPPVELPLTLPS